MSAKEVNVTNLRQNLQEYLAQVEAGDTLRITVHGRAIAEIAPPGPYVQEPDAIRPRRAGPSARRRMKPAVRFRHLHS